MRAYPRSADRTALAFFLRSGPGRFGVGTIRRRWQDNGMNPTDPSADPFAVRQLTPALLERLPKDPAVPKDMVIDLMALIHQERQEMRELKQVVDLLQRLLPPPSPSAPRQQKRRRH